MINHRGWLAELLEETGAGIVVPPNDPKAAAEILWSFISDEGRLERARNASAHLADTRFNRDRLAEMLLKVFENTVQEHGRAMNARLVKQKPSAVYEARGQ